MTFTHIERGRKTDYPDPQPRVLIEEAAQSDSDRGPRVMSTEDVAERSRTTVIRDTTRETAESLPASQDAPALRDTGELLLEAAKVVNDTRARLTAIEARLADLRDKSEDIDRLKAAVDEARAQRVGLLAEAEICGRKANLTKADQRCAAAVVALEKRRDEVTAVEGALAALLARRAAAAAELEEVELAFKEARAAHLNSITETRTLTIRFHEATVTARDCLAQMRPHYRQLLNFVDLGSESMPDADALRARVTSEANAKLIAADELAEIPAPPVPTFLGYVWRDGHVRQDPEPVPQLHQESSAGLVRTEA